MHSQMKNNARSKNVEKEQRHAENAVKIIIFKPNVVVKRCQRSKKHDDHEDLNTTLLVNRKDKEHAICFQVDTGSECNVLPLPLYKQMMDGTIFGNCDRARKL